MARVKVYQFVGYNISADEHPVSRSAAPLATIRARNLGRPLPETEREVNESELNDDGMFRIETT
jgi:hypothetical protein